MAKALCIVCEHPVTPVQAFDNLTLLLVHVQSLFEVISESEEGQAVGAVAGLGKELCTELHRRADILLKLCQSTKEVA